MWSQPHTAAPRLVCRGPAPPTGRKCEVSEMSSLHGAFDFSLFPPHNSLIIIKLNAKHTIKPQRSYLAFSFVDACREKVLTVRWNLGRMMGETSGVCPLKPLLRTHNGPKVWPQPGLHARGGRKTWHHQQREGRRDRERREKWKGRAVRH